MRITRARMVATHPLFQFFTLVFALSTPFWLVGHIAEHQHIGLPYQLPISALQAHWQLTELQECPYRKNY